MEAPRFNDNAMLAAAKPHMLLAHKAAVAGLLFAIVLCLGAWGAHASDPMPNNPNTALRASAVDEAVVAVVADHAFVAVDGQVVAGTGFKVPAGKALMFDAYPEDGYAIVDVSVTDAFGAAVPLTGDAVAFGIAADDVVDGLTITVQTQAQHPNAGLFLEDEDAEDEAAPAAGDSIPVTLLGQTLEFVYDGQPHSVSADVLDEAGQPLDGYFALIQAASFTDVTDGAVPIDFEDYAIYDEAGADVTAQFDVTLQPGSISIVPATISIATPSETKVYDGQPLVADEVELVIPGIDELMDVMLTLAVTGSQTEVGQSANTYTLDWGSVNPANYRIEETLGTLSVTANEAPLVITLQDASRVYDGTPLVSTEFDFAAPDGYTVRIETSGSQTDVGTSENVVTSYVVFDAQGNDVTATFADVQTVSGTLTVEPAELSVTTPSASKTYDGRALSATSENWISGFVVGEDATASIVGSQTEVGSSLNAYVINWDGTAKQSNYRIVEDLGVLEVRAASPAANTNANANTNASGATQTAGAGAATSAAGNAGAAAVEYAAPATPVPLADTPNVVYINSAEEPAVTTANQQTTNAQAGEGNAAAEAGAATTDATQEATAEEEVAEEELVEEILYDNATPLAGIDDSGQAVSSPWVLLGAILIAAWAALLVMLLRNRGKSGQGA